MSHGQVMVAPCRRVMGRADRKGRPVEPKDRQGQRGWEGGGGVSGLRWSLQDPRPPERTLPLQERGAPALPPGPDRARRVMPSSNSLCSLSRGRWRRRW